MRLVTPVAPVGIWVLAAMSLAVGCRADSQPTPAQLVEQLQHEILVELGASRAQLEVDPERFYDLARRRLRPHFDVDRASQYILGPVARTATPSERTAFREAFEDYLITSYATALRHLTPETLTVTGAPRAAGNDVLLPVRVRLVDGETIEAHLRLRQGPSGWRIWDAGTGGASMLKLYRGDIGTEAAVHGIAQTVKSLQEVAARNRGRDLVQARERERAMPN